MFSPRLSACRRHAQSRPLHSARPEERGGQEQQSARADREESVSSGCAPPSVCLSAWSSSKNQLSARLADDYRDGPRRRMPHPQNHERRQHARPNHQDPVAYRAHERHGDDTPNERPRDDDCYPHVFECHDLTVATRGGWCCPGMHTYRRLSPVVAEVARRRCRSAFHRQGQLSVVRYPCRRDERWREAPSRDAAAQPEIHSSSARGARPANRLRLQD